VVSCFQIILMGTPILREENALRSSDVAMFQDHPCSRKPCHNGGRCRPSLDAYECLCLNGFRGERCENGEELASSIPFSQPVPFLFLLRVGSYESDETRQLNIHEMLFFPSRPPRGVAHPFHHHHHPPVTLPDIYSPRPDLSYALARRLRH